MFQFYFLALELAVVVYFCFVFLLGGSVCISFLLKRSKIVFKFSFSVIHLETIGLKYK